MITTLGRSIRCLAVWLAAGLAAGTVWSWTLPCLHAGSGAIDDLLIRVAAVVLLAGTGWLWVLATVVILEALHAPVPESIGRRVPAQVRRLVLLACGCVLVASVPALGSAADPEDPPERLSGLPMPDRAALPPRLAGSRGAGPPPDRAEVVVVPGDSLWQITAETLGEEADAATIAATWPELYRRNRELIGVDPDLILPGTRLLLPDRLVEPPQRGEDR